MARADQTVEQLWGVEHQVFPRQLEAAAHLLAAAACRKVAHVECDMERSGEMPTKIRAKTVTERASARTLDEAVAWFGTEAKAKLSNPAATGQPEDQLRVPIEHLLQDIARLSMPTAKVVAVGEAPLQQLKVRPDYAVTLSGALVGFVEIKAPGKGADPRSFSDHHDREQWAHLRALPNLVYTDGNGFSLWRNGELVDSIVSLTGDIRTAGDKLQAPRSLLAFFENFLRWNPIAPSDAKQLAEISARLCRLLRDEVVEQLTIKNPSLTALKKDWRKVLFPDATDDEFADGYAQTVTFGMLMARANNISLAKGLDQTGQELGLTLIGTALRMLTFNGRKSLPTSIGTLERVLSAVDWPRISKGHPEAWLYFYEDFLEVYDNKLRKQTGSYYTPLQVVREMVRLVDELLHSRFRLAEGLASSSVTVADPAVGTGTFILGVLQKIADTIQADQGAGAVPGAIDDAVKRLIAFDVQLGPFAVAQLRVLAELTELIGDVPSTSPRMFMTDTLANPYIEQEWLPEMFAPLAEHRREASKIKKETKIRVVIGNPPYRERAKGHGGWIEDGDESRRGPLEDWFPPASWHVGVHAKHLRNLYVYFWRWATWKVFEDPVDNNGVVCFISVAGFLNGPGFQKMRDYLRRSTDEIWIIDCSPEGHQPAVGTRIFEAVQQPICIVLASRSTQKDSTVPAKVRYRALRAGDDRIAKFQTLATISLDQASWVDCPSGWRDPFLPAATGAWATYPSLEEWFVYSGAGVMAGRTWVIAPDSDSLKRRWNTLTSASDDKKEKLFHPHLRQGKPGDKHSKKVVAKGLPGHASRSIPAAQDQGQCILPIRYGFRSFDRQWIIPDNRLINQPNPELWEAHSEHQLYLTALMQHAPTSGPALTATALIPDMHHYKGSFCGRVFPLWLDRTGTTSNIRPALLAELTRRYGFKVTAPDVFAYIAAMTAHPAYTTRFQDNLVQPGLRIPLTADGGLFKEAAGLGRSVLWLHTFGDRAISAADGRPAQPPRLPKHEAPCVPKGRAIGADGEMPDELHYDPVERRLHVGTGHIDEVPLRVWEYEISGKRVVQHWFSYRKANRDRPIIGERRIPSALGDIQPERWLSEYTTELLNLLNVLGRLVKIEPAQADLLERICRGRTISVADLRAAGALILDRHHPTKPTDIERTSPTKQLSLPLAGMPSEVPPEPIDMIERLKGTHGRRAPKSAASAESKLKIDKKGDRKPRQG